MVCLHCVSAECFHVVKPTAARVPHLTTVAPLHTSHRGSGPSTMKRCCPATRWWWLLVVRVVVLVAQLASPQGTLVVLWAPWLPALQRLPLPRVRCRPAQH